VEEGAMGGFATQVMHCIIAAGLFDRGMKFRPLCLPDEFIDHDKPEVQRRIGGIDATAIVAAALQALGHNEQVQPVLAQ